MPIATPSRRGGGLLLDVEMQVAPIVELQGERWPARDEFHVTILGREALTRIIAAAGIARASSVEPAIGRAADAIRFDVRPRQEFWRLDEGGARSIIQMCDVAGAEEFFTRLESELKIPVARPPYHITLYSIDTARGIGLASAADLERMGRRLADADQERLAGTAGALRG